MFEEILDKYIEENPLPKNKLALKEWAIAMFKSYKSAQAKKSNQNRASRYKFSKEDVEKAVATRASKIKKD